MDHRRHVKQGWSLLIPGALLGVGLLFMATMLAGVRPGTLALAAAGIAAIGVGIWALWRAGRYGLAWALLIFGLGGALVAMIGLFVHVMQALGW